MKPNRTIENQCAYNEIQWKPPESHEAKKFIEFHLETSVTKPYLSLSLSKSTNTNRWANRNTQHTNTDTNTIVNHWISFAIDTMCQPRPLVVPVQEQESFGTMMINNYSVL